MLAMLTFIFSRSVLYYSIIRPCLSAHVFQSQNAKRIYIKSDVESL
jgi:hypothetical protein